ncbi:hypothetical protein LIA77_09465 [Sarocladium implicatum]|nr:hypothetical protein LIA77_09465 [Sarocladium implicatum]
MIRHVLRHEYNESSFRQLRIDVTVVHPTGRGRQGQPARTDCTRERTELCSEFNSTCCATGAGENVDANVGVFHTRGEEANANLSLTRAAWAWLACIGVGGEILRWCG